MKTHYTEADLLETYYTEPGQSMPVMMHLAGCAECAARYARLDRKLREAASCHPHKDEAFWASQRAAVMSQIYSGARTHSGAFLRAAAAVLLVVAIGGSAIYQIQRSVPAPATAAAAVQQAEEPVPADPWQTEELQEFGEVVQWESWIAEQNQTTGEQSL